MSESERHHHHHHHHKKDGASMFRDRQLAIIERKKVILKWLMYIMTALAIILFVIMVLVYTL
jgi:UDP-N-acetylmuramyl pentapeptide phosphotransferase/UDP-N-acetylglucosamine-1-phosphate transferase